VLEINNIYVKKMFSLYTV